MPKPRVIDAGFFDDMDIAKLKRDERLLVVAMVVACADDYGRLVADPAYLRKQAFGYDDDVTTAMVAQMRANILAKCRNIKLYVVNGQEYIYFANWDKFQKIRYQVPTKLPPPPEPEETPPQAPANPSQDCSTFPQITENSGELSVNSPSVGLGSVGLSRDGMGSVDVDAPTRDKFVPSDPLDDPPDQEQTPTPFKASEQEFGEVFTAWENARGGTVNATESELLSALVDEFGPSRVREGITTAVKYNKFDRVTIGYLEKIVKNPMHYGTRGAPGNGNGRTREGSFIAEARAAGMLKQ